MEHKVLLSEVIATFGGGFVLEGDDYSGLDWQNTDITKPTEEEVNAKRTEMQAEYDSQEYARNRKEEYPEIADQLDMIYWDGINETTTHKDAIDAIKTKYPKP